MKRINDETLDDSPSNIVEDNAKSSQVSSQKFVCFNELPEFLKDNEYLLKWHRPQLNSFFKCLTSMFEVHTETINIWSHLLGAVYFVILTFYFMTRSEDVINLETKFTFTFLLFGAITCLSCSSSFHCFSCHSPEIGSIFRRFDYCGVIIMIVFSSISWFYFAFYCDLHLKIIYITSMVVLGAISIGIVIPEKFGTPEYRGTRAGLFIIVGLSAAIPALHHLFRTGFWAALDHLIWLIISAVCFLSGGSIYAVRFPECMWAGKFDIWGQSHQILHLCVLIGAWASYRGAFLLAQSKIFAGCEI